MQNLPKSKSRKPVSLVTGVAGFIGSHVAAELITRGHEVLGLDNLATGFMENVPLGSKFIAGSIVDPELVSNIFQKHRIDFVFHLAAYAAEGFSHFVRGHIYRHNILGSANLINAAAQSGRVRCFVFTSSAAVYGGQPGPWSEESVPRPIDPYGISKHAIELDLQCAFAMFGLPSIIFRPHNVYGPGQNLCDPHRNVIGIFVKGILEGRSLPIFGDGSQTRAFTYIADVAPVIAGAVDNATLYNGVFNIGSDRPYPILELARKVGRAMDVKPYLTFLPARREATHTHCSHERLQNLLPDLPRPVELDGGLKEMVAWAKRVGLRHLPPPPPIEVAAHLPKYWRAAAAVTSVNPARKISAIHCSTEDKPPSLRRVRIS